MQELNFDVSEQKNSVIEDYEEEMQDIYSDVEYLNDLGFHEITLKNYDLKIMEV